MATLDSDFEDKLEAAVLDEVEEDLRRVDGPVAHAIARSERRLQLYAEKYDVEPILDSLEGPHISREGDTITVEWEFTHGASGFFEFGTTDHKVEGNPVLAFEYPKSEGGPGDVVFSSGHMVSGLDETRFTRYGLEELRHELAEGV